MNTCYSLHPCSLCDTWHCCPFPSGNSASLMSYCFFRTVSDSCIFLQWLLFFCLSLSMCFAWISNVPNESFPPLCSQHFALRTSLVLLQLSYHYFHHFFSSNPTPHQVLSSSRSRISPHCSSHCPSPAQSWAPTRGSADVSWVTVWSIARRACLSSGGVCVWGEVEGKYGGSRIQLRMK